MAKTATKTCSKRSTKVKAVSTRSSKNAEHLVEEVSTTGDDDITIDRRRAAERREEEAELMDAAAPQLERRKKVTRRRQIDPTTCERDYTDQEVEFMNALDDYKRKSGRMFPTCSEVLEVINSLGYVKLSPGQLLASQSNACLASAKPMTESAPVLAADEVFAVVGE